MDRFPCASCHKSFKTERGMQDHRRTVHPIKRIDQIREQVRKKLLEPPSIPRPRRVPPALPPEGVAIDFSTPPFKDMLEFGWVYPTLEAGYLLYCAEVAGEDSSLIAAHREEFRLNMLMMVGALGLSKEYEDRPNSLAYAHRIYREIAAQKRVYHHPSFIPDPDGCSQLPIGVEPASGWHPRE